MCVSQVWNLRRAEALIPHFLGQVEEYESSGGGWLSLDLRAGEPRVAADLVWVVLLMADPFLNNDSAQETVPQGSDPPPPQPPFKLRLLGLEPVPFPKCLLVQRPFMVLYGKMKEEGARWLHSANQPSFTGI